MARGFNVDELVASVRAEQERRIEQQAEAVRALGQAANRVEDLRAKLAAAESDWATAYSVALGAGLDAKVISKLKPPTEARPARTSSRRGQARASQ
jgi:hypothetical protein